MLGRVMDLPRDDEPVHAVEPLHVRVQGVGRLEICKSEEPAFNLKPMPEYMQCAHGFEGLDQPVNDNLLNVRRMAPLEVCRYIFLCVPDEPDEMCWVDAFIGAKRRHVATYVFSDVDDVVFV